MKSKQLYFEIKVSFDLNQDTIYSLSKLLFILSISSPRSITASSLLTLKLWVSHKTQTHRG